MAHHIVTHCCSTVDFEADASEATAADEKRQLRDRPTLVGCGENAGDSRVVYRGHNLPLHLITRDFFITLVSMNTAMLFSLVGLMYLFLFLFWSFIWWLITKFYSGCLVGSTSYVESLTFAAITQMTIGKGKIFIIYNCILVKMVCNGVPTWG